MMILGHRVILRTDLHDMAVIFEAGDWKTKKEAVVYVGKKMHSIIEKHFEKEQNTHAAGESRQTLLNGADNDK